MSGLNSGPQILKPCMGKNMLLASACGRSDKACPVVIDHTVKRSVALPFIMYFLFYFKDRLVLHSIYPISTLNYNIFTWVLEKVCRDKIQDGHHCHWKITFLAITTKWNDNNNAMLTLHIPTPYLYLHSVLQICILRKKKAHECHVCNARPIKFKVK